MKKIVLLADKIEKNIKEMIENEKLSTGDKIPNEMELSKILGVSRSTVREAVRSLVSKNVLEIKRGKGTFVKNINGMIDDPFGFEYVDKKKLVSDLFEARTKIEPEIAYLAAQRAKERDKEVLKDIIDEMTFYYEKLRDDVHDKKSFDKLMKSDQKFHAAIAKVSGNTVFERLIPLIVENISEVYFNEVFKRQIIPISANHHHNLIYKAIEDNNPSSAKEYCIDHMNALREYLIDII